MILNKIVFIFLFLSLIISVPAFAKTSKKIKINQKQPNIESVRKNKQYNHDELYKWCKEYAHPKTKDDDLDYMVRHIVGKKDPILLMSIIKVESQFLKTAVSKKNAVGLMQIMPSVWMPELRKEFPEIKTRKDLFGIKTNIDAGEFIIYKYIDETGSLYRALRNYGGSKHYAKK